jgi:hypothetical protein
VETSWIQIGLKSIKFVIFANDFQYFLKKKKWLIYNSCHNHVGKLSTDVITREKHFFLKNQKLSSNVQENNYFSHKFSSKYPERIKVIIKKEVISTTSSLFVLLVNFFMANFSFIQPCTSHVTIQLEEKNLHALNEKREK